MQRHAPYALKKRRLPESVAFKRPPNSVPVAWVTLTLPGCAWKTEKPGPSPNSSGDGHLRRPGARRPGRRLVGALAGEVREHDLDAPANASATPGSSGSCTGAPRSVAVHVSPSLPGSGRWPGEVVNEPTSPRWLKGRGTQSTPAGLRRSGAGGRSGTTAAAARRRRRGSRPRVRRRGRVGRARRVGAGADPVLEPDAEQPSPEAPPPARAASLRSPPGVKSHGPAPLRRQTEAGRRLPHEALRRLGSVRIERRHRLARVVADLHLEPEPASLEEANLHPGRLDVSERLTAP